MVANHTAEATNATYHKDDLVNKLPEIGGNDSDDLDQVHYRNYNEYLNQQVPGYSKLLANADKMNRRQSADFEQNNQ